MKTTIRYPKSAPQQEHIPTIQELVERDRAKCAGFAYAVGTVCLFHMKIPERIYHNVPERINCNNRFCTVLEISLPTPSFFWDKKGFLKLERGCLETNRITYK